MNEKINTRGEEVGRKKHKRRREENKKCCDRVGYENTRNWYIKRVNSVSVIEAMLEVNNLKCNRNKSEKKKE